MDDLGKSLPVTEGFISAEEDTERRRDGPRYCLNCQTVLHDRYCPHCGQKDIPKRQSFAELFSNFISSFWSFESKFFKTGYLLLKPGFLATEYTAGRRERYYHPARMYVFISFVYFLLLAGLPDDSETDPDHFSDAGETSSANTNVFSIDSLNYKSYEEYDSVQRALPEAERDGWFMKLVRRREIALNTKYKDDTASFGKDFGEMFLANFPKVFFFLLPVFAAIFKLLYVRRDFFYSEHLVFTIYYYNFFFLAGAVYLLLDQVPALDIVTTVLGFWIVFYLLFAMKRMYQQRWGKTILKFGVFLILFGLCVGLGLLANVVIILLYI